MEAPRRAAARPALREIDEQTRIGEVYMTSLIRSQRRLAAVVCVGVALLLVGTALAGAFSSRFSELRVLGVPLPWVALGVLVYPALIALAWYAVRQADRNERAFTELVHRR